VYTKSSERCIGGYALISWSQSGEQRWRTPLEDDSFRLLGDRDHIYVWWDYPSSIQALDRASGRTIWRRRYHECVRAIVPLPGRVLVLVHDEATETVDTATGQLLQQQLIDDASLRHSNFEVRWPWIFHQGWEDNERSSLHAIHLVSGRQWAQRLPLGKDDSVWERDIAVSEERAYVPTIHGLLFALDLSSGRQLWFSHIGSDQSGGTKIFPARPPGAKEEWVLVSPLSGHLLALDPTRPLPPARSVLIRGKVRTSRKQDRVARVRVWVGQHLAHTDNRGRFWARVRTEGPVHVHIDARDINGCVGPHSGVVWLSDAEQYEIELGNGSDECGCDQC